jgi:DNA-binding PadR family transcriptional regulator
MKTEFDQFLPLSTAALHILLALSNEDRHGYGIMQEIARQSGGKYKLGPGTLYDNMEKLLGNGFVQEAPKQFPQDDPRRRYYKLTGTGRRLLVAELARLESVVREGKAKLRLNPRRA